MASLASASLGWICLWCFGLAVASAVFPWVNAELIVISLPSFASSRAALVVLLLVATAGHMTGKCVLYWAGRKGDRVLPERAGRAVLKWRGRLEARPSRAAVLVLLSSVTGLPPFYVMTIVAGALRMNFPLYLAAGTAGRLLRFGALVSLPQLALSFFRGGAHK